MEKYTLFNAQSTMHTNPRKVNLSRASPVIPGYISVHWTVTEGIMGKKGKPIKQVDKNLTILRTEKIIFCLDCEYFIKGILI